MKLWVPEPPTLSDKLADWEGLAMAGGESPIAGKRVLDVGPLYGVDALMFSTKAAPYIVLDSAPTVLEHVHLVAPSAECVRSDACVPWPFDDATFDLVLDFSTFDDTKDPHFCYRQAARVLAPGGILVTSYANALVIAPTTWWTKQDPDALAAHLEACGLRVFHRLREDQARAMMIADKRSP